MIDSEKVIDVYSEKISRSGWEIINRTDKGIQIKKVRRFNMLGFWVGLVLIPFWGIGLIFWILAIFDYTWQFMAGDKIRFITVSKMIAQLKAAK